MTTLVQALLTLHAVIGLTSPRAGFVQVDALPITSKPIEATAENLAWQAWIMMPPHEQNLEKSRKVTPKSIFLLPNRVKVPTPDGQPWTVEAESGSGLYAPIECPPGQRQFESRCISTLDIDREQLLIQELQILLQHGGNNNQNTYDYDYNYDEEVVAAVAANYQPPMMFKGDKLTPDAVSGSYDDAVQLPNEDAPLKFNIFSDNFPTDVEMQHKQLVSGMEMANVNSSDPWSLAELFPATGTANTTSALRGVDGAEMELENDASATTTMTSRAPTVKTTKLKAGLPITGIDAIALPAVATQPQLQKFAFYKDDSGLQLVTTAADAVNAEGSVATTQKQQRPEEFPSELQDLLKFDSLLPLQSAVVAPAIPENTVATASTTFATTATLKATTLQTPATTTTATAQTNVTSPKTTSMLMNTATTLMPKQFESLLAADARVASQDEDKEERTRSVTLSNSATTATNEPETTMDLLPTTLLPATAATITNNKQLYRTTIAAEAVEVAEEAKKLKKLKVEPAEEEQQKKKTNDELYVSQATPLPTPHVTSTQQKVIDHNNAHNADRDEDLVVDRDNNDDNVDAADDDRFYYQPVDGVKTTVDSVDASGQHEVGASTLPQLVTESSTTTTKAITTPTTVPSRTITEIDVAAELRTINELVKKGNRRQGALKKKTAAAAKATKNEVATTATKSTNSSKASPNSVDFEQVATTSALHEATTATTEADSTLTDATTTATTAATAATTAITNDEAIATATLWAKIMPLLGFGVTTTEIPATATATSAATTTTSSNNINSTSSSSNRSHRNSKITRIDKLTTNSLSDNAKKSTTTTAITATTKTTSGSSSKAYVIPLNQATSTELPFRTTTALATTTDGSSFSPFWWLPSGWRLDRPNTATTHTATSNNNSPEVTAIEEPSLLLRFWSALPGNQVKIKE